MSKLNWRTDQHTIVIATFIVALFIRILFILQWNETPYGAHPLLDAETYHRWAQNIADGSLLRDRAFYQSPLYPYLLGLLYAVFGENLLLTGILNAVFGAATAALLARFSFQLFGWQAAAATGLLATFYRPMIFYTVPAMKEPLGLLLLTLFLIMSFQALEKKRIQDFILSGVFLGLAALVRGNVLFLAPVFLAFLWFKTRKIFLNKGAVFVGAMLLTITPATIHNAITSHDFVPINYADGFNFYIGNSETANGTNAYPPEISTDPIQEELNIVWVAEAQTGRDLTPSEVSAYWRSRAVDFLLQNPGRGIVLLKDKFEAFWNSAERFDNYDAVFIEKNFSTLLSLPLFNFWFITTIAAFAVVGLWPKQRGKALLLTGFVGAYMVSVLLFYVTDRYRLPVVVFLLPLAGAAIPVFQHILKPKNRRQLVAASALALLFLFLGLKPQANAVDLTAFDWGVLTTIESDRGNDGATLNAFGKALTYSSDIGAQAYVRASFALQRLGQEEKAKGVLRQGMKVYPEDGILRYNYGRHKAVHGDIKGALKEFQKAAELTPSYVLTYYALAKVYERLGDKKRAIAAAQRGLEIQPRDPLLLDIAAQLTKIP